ncbi:DUF624 domain-containing protein [Ectobacillus funiculus]|uniref:DUF624 domain-containing protein n=1 Tax=Ectobacillus funiculus TaxID=137993 RepID=UPI00397C0D86
MNWFTFGDHLTKRLYIILKLTGIWWLFNVPYAFLGMKLLAAPDVASVHTIFTIGMVLLPFVAIPATVATLAIARRFMKDDDAFPFLQVFWKSYKREYRKSMILGCLNAMMAVVLYLALQYYAGMSLLLTIVFYTLLIVTPFFFLFVYSFLVDQELPLQAYLINTIFLLLMHPLNAILVILALMITTYILWVAFSPLLIFIFPGLAALIVTYFYQKSMGAEIKKRQPVHNLNANH